MDKKIKTTGGIKQYYKVQAEKFGADGRSTISDINTRSLELKALLKYLKDGQKVLEIGCGNGYTASQIIQQKAVNLSAVDFSEDLIKIAQKRTFAKTKGKVKFQIGDATRLDFPKGTFDAVYTERCLINLITWEKQKKALLEIHRVLERGGIFIMLESFTDGFKNMNEARKEFGLKEIPEPAHDLFFDKEKVLAFARGKFELLQEDNFLSTYYFGARVLYPALLKSATTKEPSYDSAFNGFFKELPAFGNHSAIRVMLFRKI